VGEDFFADSDFELAPEDVKEPEPEPWPPAEEHWPARPPLAQQVKARPDFWGAMRKLQGQ
jgi:hypothetical protein